MATMPNKWLCVITHNFVDEPQGKPCGHKCQHQAYELVDGFSLGLSIHGDSFVICVMMAA